MAQLRFNPMWALTLVVLGFFSAQMVPAEGLAPGNNGSSPVLERSTRSLAILRDDFKRQRCPACEDESAGVCSTKALFRVKRYSDKLKCQPEPVLVPLKKPGPEYSVEPPVARINKCTGYCRQGTHSCISKTTSIVKVPVILTRHHPESVKCVEYEIEQDEECECGCEVLEEHCSDRHKYESCECKCKNQDDMYRCFEGESAHKTKWDAERCECLCEPEACPRGHVWDPYNCRCIMLSRSDLENQLY